MSSFDTLERMARFVEIYDLRKFEALDSHGRPLVMSVEGGEVTITHNP
jgi:hypothetical protein